MTHVIAKPCRGPACAVCLALCPVDCIDPTPADPAWLRMTMLYIDPDRCIDCGLCADACPTGAVFAEEDLPAGWQAYTLINAVYFRMRARRSSSTRKESVSDSETSNQ